MEDDPTDYLEYTRYDLQEEVLARYLVPSLPAPQVAGKPLAAQATLDATSETTFSDWSADANGDGSYVLTVELDNGETYLDVRHLSYLRLRGKADTAGDADKRIVGDSSSGQTVSGNSTDDLKAKSVEGISYVRVTADADATVYAGGSA